MCYPHREHRERLQRRRHHPSASYLPVAMGARVTRELLKINRFGLNRAELTAIQHNFFWWDIYCSRWHSPLPPLARSYLVVSFIFSGDYAFKLLSPAAPSPLVPFFSYSMHAVVLLSSEPIFDSFSSAEIWISFPSRFSLNNHVIIHPAQFKICGTNVRAYPLLRIAKSFPNEAYLNPVHSLPQIVCKHSNRFLFLRWCWPVT